MIFSEELSWPSVPGDDSQCRVPNASYTRLYRSVAFKRGAYSKVGWKRAVVAFLLLLHPEAVFYLRVFQRCLLRGRQLCTACSHGNGSRGINELRGDLEILHAKWVPSARQQWPQSIW